MLKTHPLGNITFHDTVSIQFRYFFITYRNWPAIGTRLKFRNSPKTCNWSIYNPSSRDHEYCIFHENKPILEDFVTLYNNHHIRGCRFSNTDDLSTFAVIREGETTDPHYLLLINIQTYLLYICVFSITGPLYTGLRWKALQVFFSNHIWVCVYFVTDALLVCSIKCSLNRFNYRETDFLYSEHSEYVVGWFLVNRIMKWVFIFNWLINWFPNQLLNAYVYDTFSD